MTTEEVYIPTKGTGRGTWCPGVVRRDGRLIYYFPVASGFVDFSFDYEITLEHLGVLQTDEERFYLLFAAMHETHQLEPRPDAMQCREIFDTILLTDMDAVLRFFEDENGLLKTYGFRRSIENLADQFKPQ